MFPGPGIKGNRVIGATDEKQFHVPLNSLTLATDKEKGIRIRPEHIHESLRRFAGIAVLAFARQGERFTVKRRDASLSPIERAYTASTSGA